MQSSREESVRDIVINKDVGEDPVPKSHILLADLNKTCPVHAELGITPGVFRICSVLLQEELFCI